MSTDMSWHVDPTFVTAYVDGTLTGQAVASIDAHLPTCARCRTAVAAATPPERLAAVWAGVATGMAAPVPPPPPSMAARIGQLTRLPRFQATIAAVAAVVLIAGIVRVALPLPDVAGVAIPSPTPTPPAGPSQPRPIDEVPNLANPSPRPGTPEPTAEPTEPPAAMVMAASTTIEAFAGCAPLAEHLRQHGLEHVTAWGLPGVGGAPQVVDVVAEGQAAAPQADGPPQGAAPAHSDTNVQEAGVDEPDLIETDGRHAYVVVGTTLEVLAVGDATPRRVAQIDLGDARGGSSLLLRGDRLLVLSSSWREPQPADDHDDTEPAHWGGHPVTQLRLIDVRTPAAPTVVHAAEVDGHLLSARAVDGRARVVVRSDPARLGFVHPDGNRTEQEALAHNREVVAAATLDQWLPHVTPSGDAGTPVAPCERTVTPSEFAGFGSLSVLTVDLDGDLADLRATTVLTAGQIVYASRDTLYVGTNQWWDPWVAAPTDTYTTDLHAFDISTSGPARYLGSGAVTGHLLNQFSMSEHAGHLRVATTEGTPWEEGSVSSVHVLRLQDEVLVPVGWVGGLGPGERIYAVRFMGDVGYVVTFRQVDPLYTLDLRDPTAPRVVGELKIPGYSAYLHPAGPGALFGLGQDADPDGRPLGMQLSLFDVSDLSNPQRQSNLVFGESSSDAEWDHHAFLYWQPANLVVVPLSQWSRDPAGDSDSWWSGAVAVRLSGGQLREAGRIEHPETDGWRAPILRSFVVGTTLFTVSATGVQGNDLDTLAVTGWQPFA